MFIDQLERETPSCVDVHRDPIHHRSVFTLIGTDDTLLDNVVQFAARVVSHLDLTTHVGVHPRFGVLDVVPFVPLANATLEDACVLRDNAARRLAEELALPCFLYGPLDQGRHQTLPEVRRGAFESLTPDLGPSTPHPRAGASAVGARSVLLAWNLWLSNVSLTQAQDIARQIRSKEVRALGLQIDNDVQVSCNLLDPSHTTPADVHDRVLALLPEGGKILRAELVGLAPQSCLDAVDPARWSELNLKIATTIEAAARSIGFEIS